MTSVVEGVGHVSSGTKLFSIQRNMQDEELLAYDGIIGFFGWRTPLHYFLASLERARVFWQHMPAKRLRAGKRDQPHSEATERPSYSPCPFARVFYLRTPT